MEAFASHLARALRWFDGGTFRSRPLILLAEPDPDHQVIYSELLTHHGYSVRVRADGPEALRIARTALPDLVITDFPRPVRDGVSLAEALKRDAATARIPVLAIVSDVVPETEHRARAVGCVEVLTKPVDFEGLVQTVRELT